MHGNWTDQHSVLRAGAAGRVLRQLALALACSAGGLAHSLESDANPATALRASYGALQAQPGRTPIDNALHLDSVEAAGSVTGSIHAIVNHPIATAGAALNSPLRWCDILMLHLNTKYCRAATEDRGSVLRVYIGKKHDQPLEDAYPVSFAWRLAAASPDYLKVMLSAKEGPLGTRDYRIMLEATSLDAGHTLLHLRYSYTYGFAGRVAMQAYLGTIASAKRGFTVVGKQPNGEAIYIDGMRGLVERNTMRYYLAIEAYLGALSVPPAARLEKSLHDWFAAIERHPRQLHELEQGEYLAMKRKEHVRARAGQRMP